MYLETHGSGYGQHDDQTGGKRPLLSGVRQGGFVNSPSTRHTPAVEQTTKTLQRLRDFSRERCHLHVM